MGWGLRCTCKDSKYFPLTTAFWKCTCCTDNRGRIRASNICKQVHPYRQLPNILDNEKHRYRIAEYNDYFRTKKMRHGLNSTCALHEASQGDLNKRWGPCGSLIHSEHGHAFKLGALCSQNRLFLQRSRGLVHYVSLSQEDIPMERSEGSCSY